MYKEFVKGAKLCKTGTTNSGSFSRIVALANSSSATSSFSVLTEVVWEEREYNASGFKSETLHDGVATIILGTGEHIDGPIRSFKVAEASATRGGNDVLAYNK